MGLTFTYPAVLVLLTVPMVLLHWAWSRRGREVAIPSDAGIQPSGDHWHRMVRLSDSFPGLALMTVIVLLAGPQTSGEPRNRRSLTNIEFCVDNSGSMTGQFGDQTRYEASMQAITEFVDYRDGDAFGLTFFSDETLKWVPLTTDTSAFKYALPFMDPRLPLPDGFGGGTQIGRGLEECRRTLLQRQEGDRMIVLVSDGASADLYNGRAEEIAASLKRDGIIVYDIHIAEGEVPEEIVNIAYLTDGEVFQPGDRDALAAVFKRIDGMQQAKIEKVVSETHDAFVVPAILGLGCLGCCLLGMFGMRYTPW